MSSSVLCVKSSISKKVLMAVTGLLLVGFVCMHLLGNLFIFAGPEALNKYAAKLAGLGPLLWVARISLLGIVGLHIWAAITLTRENRAARPQGYESPSRIQNSLGARTMMLSGLLIFSYIIFHLLHFTFKVTHPDISHHMDATGHIDVYYMVVESFKQPLISIVYIISMVLLGLHLSHGLSSLVQTLGLTCEKKRQCIIKAGKTVAVALCVGYSMIPLSVLIGIVK